jgi:branched-chain amino acid transport system permease protein
MFDATQILQNLVSGVGVGLIYGLVGIGFCVIYNASGIVNFAQGIFVMLGGMLCHSLLTVSGLPLVAAAIVSVMLVSCVGVGICMLVVQPMRNRGASQFSIILATLAVLIMLERLTMVALGDQPRSLPAFSSGGPLKIGQVAIDYQLFWILGCGALMVTFLWLFFARTQTGQALRACSQNPEAAALLGIPVSRMLLVSFALSAALGAVAGILVAPTQYTSYSVGLSFGISGFIAAIIGGFGSAGGALAGGILLGLTQAFAISVFGAGFKNVAALGVMLLILTAFPTGLFSAFNGAGKGH